MSNSTWNTAGHYYRSDHSWSLPQVSNDWHFPHQTSSTYTKPVPHLSFPVSLGEVKGRDSRQPGDPHPRPYFLPQPFPDTAWCPGVQEGGYFPWQEAKPDLRDTSTHQGSQLMSLTFLVRSDNEGIADISGNTSLISPFYKF